MTLERVNVVLYYCVYQIYLIGGGPLYLLEELLHTDHLRAAVEDPSEVESECVHVVLECCVLLQEMAFVTLLNDKVRVGEQGLEHEF